jgi:hypothetical protein
MSCIQKHQQNTLKIALAWIFSLKTVDLAKEKLLVFGSVAFSFVFS